MDANEADGDDLVAEVMDKKRIGEIISDTELDMKPAAQDTPKSFESLDFYDESYQSELREFCHYYQIPYLEADVPKTTKNAAKIYFRMKADDVKINSRFESTGMLQFI